VKASLNTDNFIEDFCAKNKFNKRHSAMIKKIYEQQSSGDWFKRGQLDMDKTAFNVVVLLTRHIIF